VLTDSNLTTTTTDTADLLFNDQESLENSSNKSDNTIADETNSGIGVWAGGGGRGHGGARACSGKPYCAPPSKSRPIRA
jgi:hypothetical protein